VAEHSDQPLVWIGDRISVLQNGAWSNRVTTGYQQLFPSNSGAAGTLGGTAPLPALAAVDRLLVGRPRVQGSEAVALVFVDPDQLPHAS
jgi:hypothetical protein